MSENGEHLDIQLRASPDSWRVFSARKADTRFKPFEKKVFDRDRYTCQFCGFQAKAYQEVVNVDGNYSHNKLSNMVTACCFCTQCFFIESVGMSGYGGGSLIYVPELTQAEINSLCHVLFCAITNDTGYKNTSQMIYRGLKARSQPVEDKFGEGTSDPGILGGLLISSGNTKPEVMEKVFKNVRLLPSMGKFRRQIEYWAASALEEIEEKQ